MKRLPIKVLIISALLVALSVILGRFASIRIPLGVLRLSELALVLSQLYYQVFFMVHGSAELSEHFLTYLALS